MKRSLRFSMCSAGSSLMVPATWERKPCSAISSDRSMPERPAFNDSSTSAALLPMGETIPMPVTTTRLMSASLGHGEAHAHVLDLGHDLSVGLHPAVGHAHLEAAVDDLGEVHDVADELAV